MKRIIVGITGASGSILAHHFIKALLTLGHEVHLAVTSHGRQVLEYELERKLDDLCEEYQQLPGRIFTYANDDLFASIASGSFRSDAMVIIPCSMGTLAKTAHGIADSLLNRAADVMLKENRRLVLVPRETPLSPIHLENMLKLSRLGVTILPPLTPYYHKPGTLEESIDLIVGRILDSLGMDNPYHKVWGDNYE